MQAHLLLLLGFLIPSADISIGCVGDIMLGHRYVPVLRRHGCDYPFRDTAALLQSLDLLVGNLESPVTDRGKPYLQKKYHFRADPAVVPALRRAGFGVLTVANNHSLDYGPDALYDTLSRLAAVGIGTAGAGRNRAEAERPCRVVASGVRVSFFAYNRTRPTAFYATDSRPGTATASTEHRFPEIRRERENADFIVASFHWGGDYRPRPKSYQRTIAAHSLAAGADLVVGHHPHVLQGIEIRDGKPIIYSAGNFTFGSYGFPPDRVATQSALFEVRVAAGSVRTIRVHPLNVNNQAVAFCPRPAKDKEARRILSRYAKLCRELGTTLVIDEDATGVVIPGGRPPEE